jgi:hypothetical protein
MSISFPFLILIVPQILLLQGSTGYKDLIAHWVISIPNVIFYDPNTNNTGRNVFVGPSFPNVSTNDAGFKFATAQNQTKAK